MSEEQEMKDDLIPWLYRLADSNREDQSHVRAAFAHLRRGLRERNGVAPEMHQYVLPHLPDDLPPYKEDPYYQVAALFAWHQIPWRSGQKNGQYSSRNLGASYARLMADTPRASIERRFVALLNAHQDDLYVHLRGIVGLLRSNEIPIDWYKLLHDIERWGAESRHVERSWARAFWSSRSSTTENSSSDNSRE